MMSRRWIILALFLPGWVAANNLDSFSLTTSDPCLDLLVQTINKMKNFKADRLYMDYEVRSNMIVDQNEFGNQQSSLRGTMHISPHKSAMLSPSIDVYRDDSLQISVIKDDRVIYLTRPMADATANVRAQLGSMLQDSLMNHLTLLNCETLCDSLQKDRFIEKVEMGISTEEWEGITGMKAVTFWIDRKHNLINRIRITYANHPHNVKDMELILYKYDLSNKADPFNGSAYGRVFSAKGVLQKKYKGYKVVDYRK